MLKPQMGGVFTVHGSRALAYRAEIQLFVGWVAEWLCSGLQSRVHRFDSGLSLQIFCLNPARVAELVDAADLKSAGHCGRAGSIPAPGTIRSSNEFQYSPET